MTYQDGFRWTRGAPRYRRMAEERVDEWRVPATAERLRRALRQPLRDPWSASTHHTRGAMCLVTHGRSLSVASPRALAPLGLPVATDGREELRGTAEAQKKAPVVGGPQREGRVRARPLGRPASCPQWRRTNSPKSRSDPSRESIGKMGGGEAVASGPAGAGGADDWRAWELAAWDLHLVRHFFLRGAAAEGL